MRERMSAALATLFGAIALGLAAVGLYGVMLYQVAERTTEIGIRVALGARPATVMWLVLRQSLIVAAIGLGAGLPLAILAGRAVQSQLYGVAPYDVVGARRGGSATRRRDDRRKSHPGAPGRARRSNYRAALVTQAWRVILRTPGASS